METAAWVPREELEKARGDREIDLALTRSGARNLTAARALLPPELVSASQEAIAAAVEKVKKENQWMFRDEPLRASGYPFTPKPAVDLASMTDAEYYEYRRQQKKAR